jgi:hypothetical protein
MMNNWRFRCATPPDKELPLFPKPCKGDMMNTKQLQKFDHAATQNGIPLVVKS